MNAVLITMAVIMLPFMILPIFMALERIPKSLTDAAADLGATPWQRFRDITLPMSLPGAVVGGMFCFVLALGDFLAPELVGGTQGFTFGRLDLQPVRHGVQLAAGCRHVGRSSDRGAGGDRARRADRQPAWQRA